MITALLITGFSILDSTSAVKRDTAEIDYLKRADHAIVRSLKEETEDPDSYDMIFEYRYRHEQLLHDSKLTPTFFCSELYNDDDA